MQLLFGLHNHLQYSYTSMSDTENIQKTEVESYQSAQQSKPQKSRKQRLFSTLSSISILLLAPVLAVVLTLFVFQSYQVDGPSMEPSLLNKDRLIVWKLPRTWAKVTGHQYVPNRGDVIILNESGLSSYGSPENTKQLVKRVIGLPGDHVVIKDGIITIYNSANPSGLNPDKTLPYGEDLATPVSQTDVDIQLSSTQLFVVGDNRTNSLDSRTFGPIETEQVIGKLVARILPLSQFKLF